MSTSTLTAYHATVNQSWPPAGEFVHVGTKAGATQRMGDFDWTYFDPRLAGTSLELATWKVHELQVHGRVYPHLLTDDQANDIVACGDPDCLTDDGLPSGTGYQVFPYVNHCEDKGSVSWLVDPSVVQVISTDNTGLPVSTFGLHGGPSWSPTSALKN